jgi:molybdopterin/thiamine biosynthesis adenylyltransferase
MDSTSMMVHLPALTNFEMGQTAISLGIVADSMKVEIGTCNMTFFFESAAEMKQTIESLAESAAKALAEIWQGEDGDYYEDLAAEMDADYHREVEAGI